MKICMIVYGFYEFDGRVQRMAISLKEKGYSVDIISLKWKNKENYNLYNGIKVYKILGRQFKENRPAYYFIEHLMFLIVSSLKLTYLYFKEKYDLIHVNNIPDFLVFATIIPKIFGAKIILDIHDVVPEFAMQKFSLHRDHIVIRLLKITEYLSTLYANHVITVSELWKERLLSRGIPRSKCSVIPNEPNLKTFNSYQLVKNKTKRFTIFYHGNLSEQNGLEILIRAVRIIKDSIPSFMVTIIGDLRKDNDIEKLIRELNLTQYFILLNSIPHCDIPKVIYQADIGIDPKKDGIYSGETIGIKIMEYMAMGIPIIVSRTKVSDLHFNDSIVEFFESEDEKDLAEKIVKLYNCSERRLNLINSAKEYIKEHNWDNNKQKYHSLIEHLVLK